MVVARAVQAIEVADRFLRHLAESTAPVAAFDIAKSLLSGVRAC